MPPAGEDGLLERHFDGNRPGDPAARPAQENRPSGDDAGMGIRFVWSADADRQAFERVVEELMERSLGPVVTQNLLKRP